MRQFVESLARLFPEKLTKEKVDELLENKKINEQEYQYVLSKNR